MVPQDILTLGLQGQTIVENWTGVIGLVVRGVSAIRLLSDTEC